MTGNLLLLACYYDYSVLFEYLSKIVSSFDPSLLYYAKLPILPVIFRFLWLP